PPAGAAGRGAGPVGGDVDPVGAGDRAEPAAPVAGGVDEDRPAAVAGAAPQAVAAGAADGHGQPAGGGALEPLGGVRHLGDVVQVRVGAVVRGDLHAAGRLPEQLVDQGDLPVP